MKKILILFIASQTFLLAQEKQKKNTKTNFIVYGNCEMCEKRIEKAALSVKGVKLADWDIPSNQINLIYNPKKAELKKIHKQVAAKGHDTSEIISKKIDYDALPVCCQYIRRQ